MPKIICDLKANKKQPQTLTWDFSFWAKKKLKEKIPVNINHA